MASTEDDIFILISFEYLLEARLKNSLIFNEKIFIGNGISEWDELKKVEFLDIKFSEKIYNLLYITEVDVVDDDIH